VPIAARKRGREETFKCLFASKIRGTFFEERGDAFAEIVGFAGFDLAFVFEGELSGEIV
jgi:hypothetical protein